MPFCPNCKYKYKEDIKKCPDCGSALVDKLPEESSEGLNYVPLRSLPSRLYAEMLQEALENEGIRSMIKGEDEILGPLGAVPQRGVTIWVQEQGSGRAEEIANQMMDQN